MCLLVYLRMCACVRVCCKCARVCVYDRFVEFNQTKVIILTKVLPSSPTSPFSSNTQQHQQSNSLFFTNLSTTTTTTTTIHHPPFHKLSNNTVKNTNKNKNNKQTFLSPPMHPLQSALLLAKVYTEEEANESFVKNCHPYLVTQREAFKSLLEHVDVSLPRMEIKFLLYLSCWLE